jgi:hypothetical protein
MGPYGPRDVVFLDFVARPQDKGGGAVRPIVLGEQDKSVMIRKECEVTRKARRGVARAGIQMKLESDGKDLGLDAVAGASRSTKVFSASVRKAKVRSQRIGVLSKFNKEAKKLYRTGAQPQGSWGHQSVGCAANVIQAFRAMANNSIGHTMNGRCTTTALAIEFPSYPDPAVSLRIEPIK